MSYIIYKATHQRNGRVYIGITSQNLEERIYNHRVQANSAIYHEVRNGLMYFEVIDSACNHHQALGKESYYITQFNSLAPNGYNRVKSSRYVVGHAERAPDEIKQEQRKKREERRLIRSGKIRAIPSLHEKDGWYSPRSMIDTIQRYKDVKYQQYIVKVQRQKDGLNFDYMHHVLFAFTPEEPVSDLVKTQYIDAFYNRVSHEWEYYAWHNSYRSITSNIWDWIYDSVDKDNQRYINHRNVISCPFDVSPFGKLAVDAFTLVSDVYHFPITIEDYLSGRK